MRGSWLIAIAVPIMLASPTARAQQMDLTPSPGEVRLGAREYSPYLNRGFPQRVYWGDTHLHTAYSTDAGMIGCTLGPEEAYRFARGEMVVASGGVRARLERPLDFLVVADHAENLGLAPMIAESDPELLRTEFGKKIHGLVHANDPMGAYALWGSFMAKREDPLGGNDALTRSVWERITSYAEKYNQPGVFTAFIGFEWTSSPGGNNLHRNIVFRGDKHRADLVLPFSNYDSTDPRDLWKWMAAYEGKSGDRVLAIPHNGNLSNGLMFDMVTLIDRRPLDRDYAERRMRWEPIYEVTQIKGDGETHPKLSPNDEFADYGTWDKGSFGAAKDPGMIEREYAREALKRGLALEQKLGVNPFKFGMIGSTDAHTALATTQEDNFFGKATPMEPGTEARYEDKITGLIENPDGRDFTIRHYKALASGLAGVWATENTREALFDAMKRKEVYATTGTRMTVRVFAGWDFTTDEVQRPDFWLRARRPDGWRPAGRPAWRLPALHGARAARPGRREPRPHPDRQGVAPGRRNARREGLRRRLGRRPRARRRRQAAAGRQHGPGRALRQHHRRGPADGRLAGPRLRSGRARRLLRARARDPDPDLARLRQGVLRRHDRSSGRRGDGAAGARLHLADLVHAVRVCRPIPSWRRGELRGGRVQGGTAS
jgi:hypothetical protein